MKEKVIGSAIYQVYSVADCMSLIQTDCPWDGASTYRGDDVSFYGAKNHTVNLEMMRGGLECKTKGDKLSRDAEKIIAVSDMQGGGNVSRFDCVGDILDPAKFAIGAPCFSSPTLFDVSKRSKIVELITSSSVNCDVSSDSLVKLGTAIYLVVRALEMQRFSVGVTIGGYTSLNGLTLFTFIPVKLPSEYCNPYQLAYWITTVAAYRMTMFRIWEEEMKDDGRCESFRVGYGCSQPLTIGAYEAVNGKSDTCRIVLDQAENGMSIEQFYSRIRGQLINRGVTLSVFSTQVKQRKAA